MSKKSYSEELKDPRWQKKRLEIMTRDNWTCQICGDKRDSLQVHHKEYISNKKPWEYSNLFLITLCETCHSIIENSKEKHGKMDFKQMRTACFGSDNDNAFTIYRYKDGQPLILLKRGQGIYLSIDDIKLIRKILK